MQRKKARQEVEQSTEIDETERLGLLRYLANHHHPENLYHVLSKGETPQVFQRRPAGVPRQGSVATVAAFLPPLILTIGGGKRQESTIGVIPLRSCFHLFASASRAGRLAFSLEPEPLRPAEPISCRVRSVTAHSRGFDPAA